MAYNPKTNWNASDTPLPSDFNRIEQGIYDAHQAAEAAQQVATTAQTTANSAQTALTSHADAAAPHSGHAKIGEANTFTARQKFAAGVQDGQSNADLSFLCSLPIPLDTRSLHATERNDNGDPVAWEIRGDGGAVIASAAETYNEQGSPIQMVITVPRPDPEKDIVITINQVYDEDGVTFLDRTQEVTYV